MTTIVCPNGLLPIRIGKFAWVQLETALILGRRHCLSNLLVPLHRPAFGFSALYSSENTEMAICTFAVVSMGRWYLFCPTRQTNYQR